MQLHAIKQKKPLATITMLKDTINSPERRHILILTLIFVLFILSLGLTQGTLGKFSKSFSLIDSALAAKFDITITTPEEFRFEQEAGFFEYRFVSYTDIKPLSFQVSNNGEFDVLCIPHISDGLNYGIFTSEGEFTEFVLKAKETVSFWLVLLPVGLDQNILETEFFIDIQQLEG